MGDVNFDEYNRTIRSMVQHEDGLRGQRLGWLLALNGFMFASLGFAWDQPEADVFIIVVALLGVVMGISAVAANLVSDEAIARLEKNFNDRADDTIGSFPPIRAVDSAYFRRLPGLKSYLPKIYIWNLMPWALILAWLGVLLALWARDDDALREAAQLVAG